MVFLLRTTLIKVVLGLILFISFEGVLAFTLPSSNSKALKVFAGKVTIGAGGAGNTDGTGNNATFNEPDYVVVDSSGNLFIADSGNYKIRKVTPAGVVTTFAGTGSLGISDGTGTAASFGPFGGMAIDSSGNIYVTDRSFNTIRKITSAGVVTTLAGDPLAGTGSTDGTGSAARFNRPQGLAVDSSGNVYVADRYNYTIRKITPAGVVTTFAGTAGSSGNVNGTGAAARFYFPVSLTIDSSNNVYILTTTNIRKMTTPGAVVTNLAGGAGAGFADGTGTAAAFKNPEAIAIDSAGNIFVTDTLNNLVRKVTSAGVVTTFAGLLNTEGTTDGTGSAARFYGQKGIAVDSSNNLYIADPYSNNIRKVTPAAVVTTFVGAVGTLGSTDGARSVSRFNEPQGIVVDSTGNFYLTDTSHTIRKISSAGVVSTLAGTTGQNGGSDGTGAAARFFYPNGIAIDSSNNIFVSVAQTIRKITSAGVVTTLAGSFMSSGTTNGTGTAARFNDPRGIAVDSSGNLFVADYNNHTIRKITSGGVVTTFAGTAGSAGSVDGTGAAALFTNPTGIAIDSSNNLYVTSGHCIRKITSAGVVTTLAGSSGTLGFLDGTGAAARFNSPSGVAVDSYGNVYVTEANHSIRKITPAGVVTKFTGLLGLDETRLGPIKSATLSSPVALSIYKRNIYIIVDNFIGYAPL